jgi:hypothetical protein
MVSATLDLVTHDDAQLIHTNAVRMGAWRARSAS